jgi:mono/diheme cytochrome c family protein
MRKSILLALTMAVSFGQCAFAGEQGNLVAQGAKVYNENCGRCHNPRPAEQYQAEEWSAVMPHMRAKAHMTGQETEAVEAFLASTLTQEKVSETSRNRTQSKPVSAETGKALVGQFGCQGCHVISGEGGNLGPALDGVLERRDPSFIRKKLHDPSFNNASSAMPRFPLGEADIDSILAYLKTLR